MATEAVTIAITAKSDGVDQELQKTKSKFDNLNQSIMGETTSKNINAMKQSLSGLGKMGDSLGGTFGKIAGGFSSLLSPIGLLTAGIGLVITAGINMYKKLTLSHEEYIDYLKHSMQESQSKLEKVNKQENTDRGYFDRLKELNKAELTSNSIKSQAIMLIQVLTAKYGDLGLSIDETTGKITGLDSALNQFENRIEKLKLNELKVQATVAKKMANEQYADMSFSRNASMDSKQGNYQTFLTSSERSMWALGKAGAADKAKERMKRWNLESGLMPSEQSRTQNEALTKQIAGLQQKQATGGLNQTEKQELQYLTEKQARLQDIMKLETKLKVVEQMVQLTASDPESNKKWKDLQTYIQDAINKGENFNIALGQTDSRMKSIVKASNEELQIRQKIRDAEKQTESLIQQEKQARQQYELSRKNKTEKMQFYTDEYKKNSGYQAQMKTLTQDQFESAEFLSEKYGKTIDDLQAKEREKTISDDEKKTLAMYRAVFGNRIKAYREAKKAYQTLKNKQGRNQAETIQMERLETSIAQHETRYASLKEQQGRLQKKQQEKPLTSSEFDRLLEINKQIAMIEQTIATSKKMQAELSKNMADIDLKRKQLQDELQDIFKESSKALDQELQMQELLLQGDIKAIEKQKVLNTLKAKGHDPEKLKKQGIDIDKQVDSFVDKKMNLDRKKYLAEQTKTLEKQIQLEQMKLDGKFDEIERQKLLNDLEEKKIALDSKQVDMLLKKQKELKALQFQADIKNQGENLLQSINSRINKKQAETDKRIKDYEAKYGKLTEQQKKKVKSIVSIEFDLEKLQKEKPDFSNREIKTNALTARGGFASGAVVPDKNEVNNQIKNINERQTKILVQIKNILQNGGII